MDYINHLGELKEFGIISDKYINYKFWCFINEFKSNERKFN